jgi:hypothetical protein
MGGNRPGMFSRIDIASGRELRQNRAESALGIRS